MQKTTEDIILEIKELLTDIYSKGPCDFGKIVDVLSLRRAPFLAMASGLTFIYGSDVDKRDNIDSFIKKYEFIAGESVEHLNTPSADHALANMLNEFKAIVCPLM